MMDVLTYCKAACEFFAKKKEGQIFRLILQKWSILKEISQVLHTAYVATNALQLPSFTLSDFFGCWLKLKYQLNKVIANETLNTNFAATLLQYLQVREKELLLYPTMLCAVYLDRRYKQELKNVDHILIAKQTLANLYERVLAERPQPEQHDESVTKNDSFESFLCQHDVSLYTETTTTTNSLSRTDFMMKLQEFDEKTVRMNHKLDILKDWEERKETFPELYEVACIIYGIPPTQVTVERSFSAMGFIFNPKRAKLGQKMLENILMIKLNCELVQSINDCDLNALA